MPSAYAGARVALGTMHGKEAAIASALRETAGLVVTVPANFDTDRFGTFTRDIARRGTMEETARAKAEAAIAVTGLAIGMGSEGSYGPHPAMPLLPAGHEVLVFVDRRRDLVIAEQLMTADVTFAHAVVQERDALDRFSTRVGFPGQWLVLRPADSPDAATGMTKGVADDAQLAAAFARARRHSASGAVLVETDMRAFGNPQRLRTIGKLAYRLGERLARRCPHCNAPGFGDDTLIPGLPCAWCGEPTPMLLAVERKCQCCGESLRIPRTQTTADPAQCNVCNP